MKLFKKNKGVLVEENKITQTLLVKNHLKRYGRITAKEAVDLYGIYRLSARIYDLRHKENYKIITNSKKVKTRLGRSTAVAEYVLVRK